MRNFMTAISTTVAYTPTIQAFMPLPAHRAPNSNFRRQPDRVSAANRTPVHRRDISRPRDRSPHDHGNRRDTGARRRIVDILGE